MFDTDKSHWKYYVVSYYTNSLGDVKISSDNVYLYKGLVNYLLVASSITSSSEIIYKDRLLELQNKLI